MQILAHNGDGPCFDLIEKNGILYTAQGTNVYVYDVSDNTKASALTWQSFITKFDAKQFIKILKIDRNYLYVLTSGSLEIYDITNPINTAYVSTYTHATRIFEHKGLSISADGNFVYISSHDVGIITVNVTNKTNPVYATTLVLTSASESNRPWRSAVSGSYLYVGTDLLDGKVYKIDISVPSSPVISGVWTSPTGIADRPAISSVAVTENGAYILAVEYHNGLWVIDAATMTTAGSPVVVGQNNYNDIKIVGTNAYVSVRYSGYDTYNISALPAKTLIQSISVSPLPGYTEGIFCTPDQSRVFLATNTMGFIIYNNSPVSSPVQLAKVLVVGGAISLLKKGNYLYIGCQNDGVWVYDVTVPTNPVKVEFAYNAGRNEQLAASGNKLFVAGDWSQLSIYDVSSPSVFVTDTYRFGPPISTITVDGNYAYVSEYQITKFGIYNISDPKNPTIVSETQLNFAGKCVRWGASHLVAAGEYGTNLGVHIIDVSNPAAPVIVSTWMAGTMISDVVIDGDVAYVISLNDIYAFNIPAIMSNPNTPALSHLSWSGVWFGKNLTIDINNKRLYSVGSTNGSIKVIDITNPSVMAEIADQVMNVPEMGYDILYDAGLLYVADYYSGIYIIDTLMEAGTGIAVSSNPSGARIFIDSSDTLKTTPDTIYNLTAGQHELKLTFSGYYDYIAPVTVTANQINNVGPVVLIPTAVQGTLIVKTLSLPDMLQIPADITINLPTPITGQGSVSVDLDPGEYTVSFGPVASYITPAPINTRVVAGSTTTIQGLYSVVIAAVKSAGGVVAGIAAFVATVILVKLFRRK